MEFPNASNRVSIGTFQMSDLNTKIRQHGTGGGWLTHLGNLTSKDVDMISCLQALPLKAGQMRPSSCTFEKDGSLCPRCGRISELL